MDDLTQNSDALRVELLSQIDSLNNGVSNLVNYGIQLAQRIMGHLSETKSLDQSFNLDTVLSFARETATATIGQSGVGGTWSVISKVILDVTEAATALLPSVMDSKNVLKGVSCINLTNVFVERRASIWNPSVDPPCRGHQSCVVRQR